MNNFFIIAEVAKFLNKTITGSIINEIYTQDKNKLLISITAGGNGSDNLIEYSVDRFFNYMVLKHNYTKAKKNYYNLFNEIYGCQILSVVQLNNDRIICFKLNKEYELIFTFFSNKSNSFLNDGNTVISSFKDNELYRNMNKEQVLIVGKKTGIESESDLKIKDYLKNYFRQYGKLILNEVLFNLNLSGEELISDTSKEIITNEFDKVMRKLTYPEYLLYIKDKKSELSLIKSNHLIQYEFKKFDDVNQLLTEFLKNETLRQKTIEIKDVLSEKAHTKLTSADKKIRNLKTQIDHCRDSESLRQTGELILQNMNEITKGQTLIVLTDLKGKRTEIKLKSNLTPAENAQNYFEKYKKQKASMDLLNKKLIKAEEERTKYETEISKINETENIKLLMKEERIEIKNRQDETIKFRKFRLNDKYEVWTGKDSASNDLLTVKYTLPNELWFHVRGASGSHAVLKGNNKGEDIPKEIISKAASVAAYFSKARNAGSVPVAYCEKKYVKKKKGFKSGSVVMEREKVIFVKPLLPEET